MKATGIKITPANSVEFKDVCLRLYGHIHIPANWKMFFAREGKVVVGSIILEIGKNGKGKIISLGVKPKYERLGIGGRLVKKAQRHFALKGIRNIEVVAAWNSGGFYERQGFSEIRKKTYSKQIPVKKSHNPRRK
jgi:ribosomal protein S18 acetylase RimI-like enzyme